MTERSRREQALAFAAMGFLVFPLPAKGKEPFPKWQMDGLGWKEYMTSEPAIINHWFDTIPDMNYALTGGDKFCIIDTDDKDGKEGTATFIAMNVEQPGDDWCTETFQSRTPSKGHHYFLRVPHAVTNSVSKIGYGVDVRGANGYVVGPGCYTTEVKETSGKIKTYEGAYTIEHEAEVQTCPQWLLDKMDRHYDVKPEAKALVECDLPHNIDRALDFLSTRAPAIETHGGDTWTLQTAAKVKDCGVSEDKCFELMFAPGGWNSRCQPAWDAAGLRKKVENAYRYGQNPIGNKSDLWEREGAFTDEEYLAGAAQEQAAKRHALEEHLFDFKRIMTSQEYREMVIPEWLISTGFTALLAQRGTGKTVTMMDMACRIACDMMWHDMPIMEDFASVYICGEDDIGARDMARAWSLANNKMPPPDRFFFMDTTCDLLSRESVEMWTRFLMEKLRGRRAVIFLDTWQRATARGAQSDEVDMQTAVHHVEAMAKSLRGPAIVAAHPPKSGEITVLGSSIIENTTSGIWHLTKEGGGERKLFVERIKGKGHGNYQTFEFREVDLKRQDDFERPITGIYAHRVGGTTTRGSAEEVAKLDTARLAYAKVIAGLIQRANEDGGKTKASFSMNDTARRIDCLPRTDDLWLELKGSGEEPVDFNQIVRRLTTLFKMHGGPCLMDEACLQGVGFDMSTSKPTFKLYYDGKPVS